jgi:hypothetical protein
MLAAPSRLTGLGARGWSGRLGGRLALSGPAPISKPMIRIAVTPAVFEAIAATLLLGSVLAEPQRASDGGVRLV